MFGFMREHGRTSFRWMAFCALAAVALVTALNGWSMTRCAFDGEWLALRRAGDDRVVMADKTGREAVLTGPGRVPVVGRESELTYGERVIRRRFDENDFTYVYTFSDGSEASLNVVSVKTDGQSAGDALTDAQRAELSLFETMQSFLEKGNPLPRYMEKNALMALISVVGLAMLCFPERAWRVQTLFSVRGGEPTDWAIVSNQAAGLFFAAVSIALACVRF